MVNSVRPSRDGDQFHYLWAARRCLRLLSPETCLVCVSIEGCSPNESTAIVTGEQQIDIAEYYGDENVSRARLVRYMQLKHSTVQSSVAWTASGLENTLKGFSARYTDLLESFSCDDLKGRLEFWFVTNRPISTRFKEAIRDAADGAVTRHPNELKKLERFTKLKGASLSSFCSLIRFEDRLDNYWEQRNILFQEVCGYLPDFDVHAPTQLKEIVTRKALSESKNNPSITKVDVLRALGTDESRLYPAPCLIESIADAVPREQEEDLIQTIIQAEKQPVIVHALAGVGKSIFSTRIPTSLPTGSVSILYDCFGNGQYRSATGYRHRHQDALVQIANELAAKGVCHPLIPTVNADASSYVRAFIYRLEQAITLIRHSKQHAVLSIVIDAADNAQMAAEEIGQPRSFARDLLRETLPDGVRLVVLCRSHRRVDLDPPVEALQLELKPFSRNETATHLRHTFPDASENDVDEFHLLSSQNPRVQALALSRNQSLAKTLRLLGPNPTTVESSIGSLLNNAIVNLRDRVGSIEKRQIDKICAGLAALRPLVPIPILSQISGVPEEEIRSFVLDIGRPLLLSGDSVQFLDEPVETWFKEQFKPSQDDMNTFIRSLKPLTAQSAYVASTLPQLMLEAGQFTELVDLALTSAALPEKSQLEKRDVELQRLQFALKASLRLRRYLDAAKLSLKAGGESAGDDRQRELIQAHTDLAALFLDTEIVQEFVSRRIFGSDWLGSHNVFEAGLLSGREELVGDARSRLRMANEWLNNWSRLEPEEREKEPISDADIAELAMVELNIHGPHAAAHSLQMWRPREVSFRVGRILGGRLVDHGRFVDLNDLTIAAGNNLCLVLALIAELRLVQKTPPVEVVERAFRLVSHARVKLEFAEVSDLEQTVLGAITGLVEAALILSVCSHIEAASLLARYIPTQPPRGLSSHFPKSHFPILRAYCLKAALEDQTIQLIDLAHPKLKIELEKEPRPYPSQEAQQFEEHIGSLLPWHQLWAAAFLQKLTKKELPDQLEKTRAASTKAERVHYRDRFHASNEIALIWFNILHFMDTVDNESIQILLSWIKGLKRPLFTPTLVALAKLGARNEATKAIALQFAEEAFKLFRDERDNADSKASGFIDVSRSILTISKLDAKTYFDEAVAVASKIGDENLSRWDSILDLADRAAQKNRPAPEVAYQFARCAELTWDYVVRDKHFDWYSTVTALSSLCPNSCIAILSRWRDRDFGWVGRILPIAAHAFIENDLVDPHDVLALIGFRAEWDYPKLLCSVLEKCEDHSTKKDASHHLFRYMQWESQSSSTWIKLKEVTEQHGLSLRNLDSYISFTEYEECIAEEQQTTYSEERRSVDEKRIRNWDEIFSGADLTTVDGISQSYSAFKNTPPPFYHDHFYREAFLRVPAGGETAFITAFGNTPEFDLYDLQYFLKQFPQNWKGRLPIVKGMQAMLEAFCRRYAIKVTKNRHYPALPFDLASKLAEVSEADIVEGILQTIGESPDLADSHRLFSLVGLLQYMLTHDEALEALSFGLGLYDSVLEGKDGDGPWSENLVPPASIHESIAGYIYAGLAAPSAKIRWEAAHAVLGLCALGRNEVLRYLVSFSKSNRGGPFVDSRLSFYRFHAFQWLMIAFSRAAHDFPQALAPFAPRFVEWALDDQPHVIIRQYAARAALALIDKGEFVAGDDLVERLSRVNVTVLPIMESKSYERAIYKKQDYNKTDDEDRFYFGIDIGPYWYKPLGRVFALSQSDIETQTLEVIRNELGCPAKKAWHEDERARRNLYDRDQSYASHGAYPDTDNLLQYLAYHAMMIVAGKLLATTLTHRDTSWGEQDEFAEWLSRHDLSRNDSRWLADRRDPPPLEMSAWQARKEDDPEYGVITPADLDEALRSGDTLNVWGRWSTANSTQEQSVQVRSTLVTPDRSMALLRALSSTKNVYDYQIPSSSSDIQIDYEGFILKGWIEHHSHEGELDSKDYWSGGVCYPPPVPAVEIVEMMTLETDLDKRIWYDGAKMPVMSSQMWGHLEVKNQDHNPERGEKLQASFNFVKDMLDKFNYDLIVQVHIERHRRHSRYESRRGNDEQIPTATKLYLINADGRVITL